MKQKIMYWFSTHCGFICCCLLLCFVVADVIKSDYHSIILIIPFLVTWAIYAQKEKECEYVRQRLQEADDFANDMKGKLDKLEKAYEEKTLAFIRTDDLKMLYIYKYLLAQNNVDLCKRKINCTKYLKRRECYERMIEFFVKDIKAKEMQ